MTFRSLACALLVLMTLRPDAAAQPSLAGDRPLRIPQVIVQSSTAGHTAATAQAPAGQAGEDDPDLDVNLAQPDFALASLPTTARLPRLKTAFRMSHRFYEPLDEAGFGRFFGLDSGAMVGLEFRVGLARGWQAIVGRTSDRTIQFATQVDVIRQNGHLPFGLAAIASIEGLDNFQDVYSPAFGAVVSRELGSRAAIYAEPVWVNNTNHSEHSHDLIDRQSSMLLGLGARLRVLETTYVVAEIVPRVGGFAPDTAQASFGIEKRAGGHLFQLTFSNGVGTTWAQLARGGANRDQWHLGFNLTRKFY